MIAKKLILLCLLLLGGCASEQARWKFNPGTAESAQETTIKPIGKNAAQLSQDLQQQVAEGKLDLPEAHRIENLRQADRARQVQNVLQGIKKEAREEYAVNRPAAIKDSILKEQLCLGMDDKDVLVCRGQPERKTRTVTHSGSRETWAYLKFSVWFEDGLVTGWNEEE